MHWGYVECAIVESVVFIVVIIGLSHSVLTDAISTLLLCCPVMVREINVLTGHY